MQTVFVIFSGFNHRAVLALCRIFQSAGAPFAIISSGQDDPVQHTVFADNILFIRTDLQLNLGLYKKIANCLQTYEQIVVCPTSEFLNHYMLHNKKKIPARINRK